MGGGIGSGDGTGSGAVGGGIGSGEGTGSGGVGACDLSADEELQAWIRGLHEFGFPHLSEQQRKGLPRSFTSVDELAEVSEGLSPIA